MKTTEYRHRVQYYETDRMGIVHHSNYIRWFEEARLDFLEHFGISFAQMEKENLSSPVVSVSCSYKESMEYGDIALIKTTLTECSVKVCFSYEIINMTTGNVACTGESSHCFIDMNTRRIISLKRSRPDIIALLTEDSSDRS